MTHDHEANVEDEHCKAELSDKYTDYIESHFDTLKAKCEHLVACINKLLQYESPLAVLKGDNVSLNKTCSLLDKNRSDENNTLSGKCTPSERDDIRQDIEVHLNDEMLQGNDWGRVKKCLRNSYGDAERSTFVDEICGLAYKETHMCNNFAIHDQVEDFFNHQIMHLKCTCRILNNELSQSGVPLPVIIGVGAGSAVLLIILLVICCICYRRRKSEKRKKRSPNVIYLPAPNSMDNCPVYQEVYDDRGFQGYRSSTSTSPPTLPMRYTSHPSAAANLSQPGQEEPAYLEPVVAGSRFRNRPQPPIPGQLQSNPGYELGAPPKYSERASDDLDAHDRAHGYFQPLPSPPQENVPSPTQTQNKGYDSLEVNRSNSQNNSGYETVAAVLSADSPVEETPTASDVPLGPVPAKRTKKDDRQTESHYFILEEGADKNTEGSSLIN